MFLPFAIYIDYGVNREEFLNVMNATQYAAWYQEYTTRIKIACSPLEVPGTKATETLVKVCKHQITTSLRKREIPREPSIVRGKKRDDLSVTIEKVINEILAVELKKLFDQAGPKCEVRHGVFRKYSPKHLTQLAGENFQRYCNDATHLANLANEYIAYQYNHPFQCPDDVDRHLIIAELMTNTDKTAIERLGRSKEQGIGDDVHDPAGPDLPSQPKPQQGDFGHDPQYHNEEATEEKADSDQEEDDGRLQKWHRKPAEQDPVKDVKPSSAGMDEEALNQLWKRGKRMLDNDTNGQYNTIKEILNRHGDDNIHTVLALHLFKFQGQMSDCIDIILKYLKYCSPEDIAKSINRPTGYAQNRLDYCFRGLRNILGECPYHINLVNLVLEHNGRPPQSSL